MMHVFRGLMARFMLEGKYTSKEELKAFAAQGYSFQASRSSEWEYYFNRTSAPETKKAAKTKLKPKAKSKKSESKSVGQVKRKAKNQTVELGNNGKATESTDEPTDISPSARATRATRRKTN